MNLEEERIYNINEILKVIPGSLNFKFVYAAQERYELKSNACVLKFNFDRYESTGVNVEICEPNAESGGCMGLLVLLHLRRVNDQIQKGESNFQFIGRLLTNNFSDILRGDFSIRARYDEVYDLFYAHLIEVMNLPETHPARQKFDNCDIDWLDLLPGD